MSNKNKKNKIWLLMPVLLLILLGLWRFLPQSLSQLLPEDAATVTGIDASCTAVFVEEGDLKMQIYNAPLSAKEEGGQAILELLETFDYRPDLRNLLPFLLKGITTAGGTKNIYLLLKWGSDQKCLISILPDNRVLISDVTGSESRLYHPSNKSVTDRLFALIRRYGE